MTASRYGVSFGGDHNALELVTMVVQLERASVLEISLRTAEMYTLNSPQEVF